MSWLFILYNSPCCARSPSLRGRDLTAQVGDFGIAAQLEHTLDMKHTCVGSPYYMSPEVCQDHPYNRKSDIWALGCVVYEMCALAPPFTGTNLMKVVSRILSGTYAPLPPPYSPALADAVACMLQSDPESRLSASQLLQMPWARTCLQDFITRAEAVPADDVTASSLLSLSSPMVATMSVSAPVGAFAQVHSERPPPLQPLPPPAPAPALPAEAPPPSAASTESRPRAESLSVFGPGSRPKPRPTPAVSMALSAGPALISALASPPRKSRTASKGA